MNRTIRQITDSLTELLPEDQQYYKLSDLRSWGFPSFIVRRIRVELERNLAESMRLPKTDWANMQSENVQAIWKQFISAIRNEAWLPASYASTVIETAVGDVLEILVEPRKNIPDVLYAAESQLTLDQLKKRVDVLVVYPHFASLLTRYMKKKDLETLSKERCAEIITKADKKITARYTPLNWAQLLEPLFQLFDEQIDSNLLRLFFEDKRMSRIARKFDFMNEAVDRAKLIETLSSPDSLNLMGYEEDQSELFEAESDQDMAETEADSNQIEKPETEMESEAQTSEVALEDESVDENKERGETNEESHGTLEQNSELTESHAEEDESSLNTIFSEDQVADTEEEMQEEETGFSLNDNFEEAGNVDVEVENEEDEHPEDPSGPVEAEAFDDLKKDNDEDQRQEEPWEMVENEEESGVENSEENEVANISGLEEIHGDMAFETDYTQEEKKETPMWQRFMSEEELELAKENDQEHEQEEEELFRTFSETENEEEENEDYLEKPIFDLTQNQEPDEEEIARLRELLKTERDYFVEQIFGGSERAYDEAIEDLSSKKDWRSASRYLENEVFKRNMIDMYSEQAVDLTDRLHSYFLKKKEADK